jgi:hypothetical protein
MFESDIPSRKPGRQLTKDQAAELVTAYRDALNSSTAALANRLQLNSQVRACTWANQTADARKWSTSDGSAVWPWPGASDTRIPLVDHYVSVSVGMACTAEARRQTNVIPLNPERAQQAAQMAHILTWLKTTQMPERATERRLFANYLYETGRAVMATVWRQTWQYDTDQVDLESIKIVAMEQAKVGVGAPDTLEGVIPQLPAAIQDPTREEEAIVGIRMLYADLEKSEARRIVTQLRTQGVADFYRPYLVENRPVNVALCPGIDFIVASNATDIQKQQQVFWREIVPVWELRARARTANWDKDWVERVEATRGTISSPVLALVNQRSSNLFGTRTEDTVEIVHAYERVTGDNGVTGIYYSVLSPETEGVGVHELLDYDHGEMPFVAARTEDYSRLFSEARGYGEVIGPFQQNVKRSTDWHIDRKSITTLPPWHFPIGQRPAEWGPGVGIETSNPTDYGFFHPPPADADGYSVSADARAFADDYMGVIRPDRSNQIEATALRQNMVDKFLEAMAAIDRQILQLAQQYLPEEITIAVIGPSASGQPLRLSRQDIQGQFGVAVALDVRMFDPEYTVKMMGLLKELLTFDIGGRLNRDAMLDVLMATLLPNYIGMLRAPQDAADSERQDTDAVFSKIFAGIGQDVKPGQAYGVRIQRMQEILQTNPVAQERLQRDQKFAKDVEAYMQQLQQQIVQTQVNPQAGRLGSLPAEYRAQNPQT